MTPSRYKRYKRYKPRPLNALIDKIFHKHYEKDPLLVVIDGALHAIVDGVIYGDDIVKIIKKEIKYNLKPLIKSVFYVTGNKSRNKGKS